MQGVHSPSSCFHSTDPPSNQSIQELSNQPAIHNVMNMPFFPQEVLQSFHVEDQVVWVWDCHLSLGNCKKSRASNSQPIILELHPGFLSSQPHPWISPACIYWTNAWWHLGVMSWKITIWSRICFASKCPLHPINSNVVLDLCLKIYEMVKRNDPPGSSQVAICSTFKLDKKKYLNSHGTNGRRDNCRRKCLQRFFVSMAYSVLKKARASVTNKIPPSMRTISKQVETHQWPIGPASQISWSLFLVFSHLLLFKNEKLHHIKLSHPTAWQKKLRTLLTTSHRNPSKSIHFQGIN